MTTPLVSVCIPTRNHARWLGEALESVFRQTLQDFEVIVADDASSDDTSGVVARWRDPRLRYLRHSRPLGVAGNRNVCLTVARGRYVAWLDADDRHHHDMLAVQVAALERHPGALLAHGGFEVIDEGGRLLPAWPPPMAEDTVEAGPEAFRELLLRNYISAPTVVVRRQAHELAGPYRALLESSEDWEMWLRIALHGDIVYTSRPVAQYRFHSGSLTRVAEAGGAQLRQDLQVIAGLFERYRWRIPQARRLESRARAALAARAVRRATDFLTRGERRLVLAALLVGWRARLELVHSHAAWRLVLAAVRQNEYAWHLASRALLRELADELGGSRMAAGLRRAATSDPAWEETLHRIARTVGEIVPADASAAFVDKWDPTLLHLSRRRGWHFPDRRTMPDGYPPDSATAISHLEDLQSRGARYLVFPSGSLWWLEHYPGLALYLANTGQRVRDDECCVIYRLLADEAATHPRVEQRWQAQSS